jgi:hypothetical protein
MLTMGTLLLAIPKRVTLSPGRVLLHPLPWRVFFGPPGLVDRVEFPILPVLRSVGCRTFMNNLHPGPWGIRCLPATRTAGNPIPPYPVVPALALH